MAFYAARQPILDINKSVYAYELLFRESLKNVFPDVCENEATSKMIDGLQTNLGLDTLTQNKLAFINFTHDTLIDRYPLLLPNDQVVVEVLETVRPGKKLLAAVKEIKEQGYIVALDDYVHEPVWKHFYPYTDIIKIDWQAMTVDEIKEVITAIEEYPQIKLLAEKVETHEDYQTAVDLGFSYFQGYFFSKPEVLKGYSLQPSQLALAQLMSEMAEEEPNINKITRAFEIDVNMSFKLLKYAQSSLFNRTQQEVSNIKQAIVAIGLQELRRFVSLMFTAQFKTDKPHELTVMSLTRARFCESIAALPGQKVDKSSAFLVGLLSLLDAMLDTSIEELLEKLPLAESIKTALIKGEGLMADYINLVRRYEKAEWEEAYFISMKINADSDRTANSFVEAQTWATERAEFSK
ncbi:EAL and HDOD domain-containing protein [Planctobacterium marinum]|uniref:EAL and HDOD domain-containing protein n=1 Tax=Planctobacterium marinum TaxID=1631968 RepID=UPI001E5C6DA9|nr:HDOD domain-containing protein [Planctobacterium marinum]MCC2604532.1 HDOD domain-containing protein [Planctobacterium marinum]